MYLRVRSVWMLCQDKLWQSDGWRYQVWLNMLPIFVRQIVLTAVVALQALDAGTWGEKIVATGILVSQGAGINLSSTSTQAEYNSVHATSVEDYVKLAPTEIRLLRLHHPSLVMWSVHVFRKSVRRLSISRGKLSQKSIKHLSNLANCEELTLLEVPIEDADFRLWRINFSMTYNRNVRTSDEHRVR